MILGKEKSILIDAFNNIFYNKIILFTDKITNNTNYFTTSISIVFVSGL